MSTRTPNKTHWNDLINHKPSSGPIYSDYMKRWEPPTWKDDLRRILDCIKRKLKERQISESSHT